MRCLRGEGITIFVSMCSVYLSVCLGKDENNWFGVFVAGKSMPSSYILDSNKMFNDLNHF